jgi:hypothetical protein
MVAMSGCLCDLGRAYLQVPSPTPVWLSRISQSLNCWTIGGNALVADSTR